MIKKICLFSLALACYQLTHAATLTVPMQLTLGSKAGQSAGDVTAADTQYGLLVTPNLHGLPPGVHGFHVHTVPSCANHAMAAGGHLDPQNTGKHLGPYNDQGHLGDMPVLIVNPDGTATVPVLAPRLKTSDLKGHTIMVHQGLDNYSDTPPLGGGGARLACGVVPDQKTENKGVIPRN
jgi:Cu-Zn family superoxide dismutase